MNKILQLPIVLQQRLYRPSAVRFSPDWVYLQWYTGMPTDYLINLMDDLEKEAVIANGAGE